MTSPITVSQTTLARGYIMDLYEDHFLVFLRADVARADAPDGNEEPVAVCQTYEEARRVKQAYQVSAQDCVIRYQGDTGGGD
jgi:hypothetical protein